MIQALAQNASNILEIAKMMELSALFRIWRGQNTDVEDSLSMVECGVLFQLLELLRNEDTSNDNLNDYLYEFLQRILEAILKLTTGHMALVNPMKTLAPLTDTLTGNDATPRVQELSLNIMANLAQRSANSVALGKSNTCLIPFLVALLQSKSGTERAQEGAAEVLYRLCSHPLQTANIHSVQEARGRSALSKLIHSSTATENAKKYAQATLKNIPAPSLSSQEKKMMRKRLFERNDMDEISVFIQSNRCPDSPREFRFHDYNKPIGDDLAFTFAQTLSSGNCPYGLNLNFSEKKIGEKGIKALATALYSGNCPDGLRLVLSNNYPGMDDSGVQILSDALSSGNCPNGLTLSLDCNRITPRGAESLAGALSSGSCPRGLTLVLEFNPIGSDGARHFANALSSGNCPSPFSLHLGSANIDSEGARAFAEALESGNCPHALNLCLTCNDMKAEAGKYLGQALKSGKCPKSLTLSLDQNGLNEGTQWIAEGLMSGNAPDSLFLNLDLGYRILSDTRPLLTRLCTKPAGSRWFGRALASGRLPDHLYLRLHDIGFDGAKQLADGLASGNAPDNLTLDLSDNPRRFRDSEVNWFATALASGNLPPNLKLDLSRNEIDDEGAKSIAEALQRGNLPENLTLNLKNNKFDQVEDLITTTMESSCTPSSLIVLF